jgi:hypothetical protein
LPKNAQKRQVRARFAWIVTLSRNRARDVPTKKQNLKRPAHTMATQAARQPIGFSLPKAPNRENDRAGLLRHAAAAVGWQCEEGGGGGRAARDCHGHRPQTIFIFL